MSVSLSGEEMLELPTVSRRPGALAVPADLRVEPSAWWALATTQADALIIGQGVAVSRVLTFIWPTLRKPVFWCESRTLSLPPGHAGTLILQNVLELDAVDQQRLLSWLSEGEQPARLIAMAPRQLLALVDEGSYSRTLYDRFKGVQVVIADDSGRQKGAMQST